MCKLRHREVHLFPRCYLFYCFTLKKATINSYQNNSTVSELVSLIPAVLPAPLWWATLNTSLWECKPDGVTALLQLSIHWSISRHLRRGLQVVVAALLSPPASSFPTLPSTLAFSLFLPHASHVATSGPLNLLFLLPGNLFSQISISLPQHLHFYSNVILS